MVDPKKYMNSHARVLIAGFSGFLLSVGLFFLYMWIYTSVLGFTLPKTAVLKWRLAAWNTRSEQMLKSLEESEASLDMMAERDNKIYRSLFGMNEISEETRKGAPAASSATMERLEAVSHAAYVQSKSFDEVLSLALKAGDMASCVPAIPPMDPDPKKCRFSSPFGTRDDPVYRGRRAHQGVDLACDRGNPIYATGDGVVELVKNELGGYGNQVLIDHGFGYKTRYAHLQSFIVAEGMKVKRGENIGFAGNTGKSTGVHLHYEVIYKGTHVNPMNYMDLSMSSEDYFNLVTAVEANIGKMFVHPKHRKRK